MSELPIETFSLKDHIAFSITELVNGPLSQIKEDIKPDKGTIHIGFDEDFNYGHGTSFGDKDVLLNQSKKLDFTIMLTGLEPGGRDYSARTVIPSFYKGLNKSNLEIHLSHGDTRSFHADVIVEKCEGFRVEISSKFYHTLDRYIANLSTGAKLASVKPSGRNRHGF